MKDDFQWSCFKYHIQLPTMRKLSITQFYGQMVFSIQSMYDAIRVYTPGKSVPQLMPNETTPRMVDIPLGWRINNGPPESPWHASDFVFRLSAHICELLSPRKLGWFDSSLYLTNVWLQLSSGTMFKFAFSKTFDRFVPMKEKLF